MIFDEEGKDGFLAIGDAFGDFFLNEEDDAGGGMI